MTTTQADPPAGPDAAAAVGTAVDLAEETVAVLGCGVMGAGIAQVFAQHGARVLAWDLDQDAVQRGRDRTTAFLDGGIARGKLAPALREEVLGRIVPTTELADIAPATLVVEAVVERLDVKESLLRQVEGVVGEHALLASNTSALSLTRLAAATRRPERVAGLHFFNPAPLMELVEVVSALQTSPAVVQRWCQVARAAGKTPVVVKDRPGFLVNRLLMPYLNDVVAAYDNGLASAADIDTAVRLGLGHRLGPLELLDLIGLDTHRHATQAAWEATRDPGFVPPPLLSRMVEAGHVGDKAGRGFRAIEEDA